MRAIAIATVLSLSGCLAPMYQRQAPTFAEVIGVPEPLEDSGVRVENVSIRNCSLNYDDPETEGTNEASAFVSLNHWGVPMASGLVTNTTDGPVTAFVTLALRMKGTRVATSILSAQSLAPGERSLASAVVSGPGSAYVFDSIAVVKVQAFPK